MFFEGTGLAVNEAPGGMYRLHADQGPFTAVLRGAGYAPHNLSLRSDTTLNIKLVKAVMDLPAIVVHTRKLSVTDILDSVLAYHDRNYLLPAAYKAQLIISLISQDSKDTFFNRVVPVTLLHKGKKEDEYRIYRAPDALVVQEGSVHIMTPDQKLRLVDCTTFPQVSLSGFLRAQRKMVEKQPAFFGTSKSDSELFYHIIVRFDKLRKSALTSMQSSALDADTTIGFLSMIIGRSDWSLRMLESSTVSVTKSLAERFRNAGSYTEVRDLIDASSRDGARSSRMSYLLKKDVTRKYIPILSEIEDNLLNISRTLFKKAPNPEASVYRYQLMIETPQNEKPTEPLEKYNMFELLQ